MTQDDVKYEKLSFLARLKSNFFETPRKHKYFSKNHFPGFFGSYNLNMTQEFAKVQTKPDSTFSGQKILILNTAETKHDHKKFCSSTTVNPKLTKHFFGQKLAFFFYFQASCVIRKIRVLFLSSKKPFSAFPSQHF